MGQKNLVSIDGVYFLTLTVVDWVDIFTRKIYKDLVVDSLRFCQERKGLILYAWVLMSNHLHLIASSQGSKNVNLILGDFKKFTARQIMDSMVFAGESRAEWLKYRFEFHAKFDHQRETQIWQASNEPKEIYSPAFLNQKLTYLHDNPVRAGIVDYPEHYKYSSAIDYAGGTGLLDVVLV